MSKKTKKEKIAKDIENLEKIIQKFESGKIDEIEDGIEEYKNAAKIIKRIKKELESFDLVIEEIKDSY